MGECHNLIVTLKEPGSLKVKQNVKVHVESVSVTVWRQTQLLALNPILHWEVCDRRQGKQTAL